MNARYTLLQALPLLAACIAVPAAAQSWSVKFGFNQITPKTQSGDLSAPALPGTKADVGANTQPIVAFDYHYDDHLAAEIVLGTPYKHELFGAGAVAGVGKLGTVESLPPTVFGKYFLLDAQSKVRPFIGLGLTYAYFQKETGSGALTALTNPGGPATTFSVDPAWGVSPQAGVLFNVDARWFADASITKSYIKTTTHFSTGQTMDIKLDPVAVMLAIGYRF